MAPKSSSRKASQETLPDKAKSRGGRPNTADAEVRAERLEAIAAEVFVELGYERASISEIARRGAASKETLYSKYANKSDLFVAVMTSQLKTAMVHFDSLVDDNRSIEKSLELFSFQLVTSLLGPYQRFVHLIFAESERFPELGRLFWEKGHLRGYSDLARYFSSQIDKKRLVARDPDLMARQFLSMLSFDLTVQSLLNVQRSLSESQRKFWAKTTTSSFLLMYGTRPKQ